MRRQVAERKRQFAKSLRSEATLAETALWRLLRSRRLAHLKFRRQAPIDMFIVDFVCFEQRLIVEADGSQHADCKNDDARDAYLRSQGFRVLRFWNNDILARSDQVLTAILAAEFAPSPVCAPSGAQPPSPARGEGRVAVDAVSTIGCRVYGGSVKNLNLLQPLPSPPAGEGGRRRRSGEGVLIVNTQGDVDGR